MITLFNPRTALATVLCAGITVHGGAVQYCPGNTNDVCYSVGVPTSSASSGAGNIYFQISAPTSFQWVALGTGSGMAGSNMFIMYQDGQGNVTISPRKGTFHTMPQLDTSSTAAQLTLLAGSGVDGSTMKANVMCANCNSWDGGEMSLASTDSSWISAWRSGSSFASTSQDAVISQHQDTAIFELDLTKATIATDSNPFVASSNSGGSSGGDSNSGSGDDDGKGSGDGSSEDGDDNGGGVTVVSANTPSATVLIAHGAIMAIVFVILYPIGALLMPLMGKWWAHGGFQAVSWALMWVGFGLGIRAAQERALLFKQSHTIFGTVIVCLLVIQPALGYAHHRYYVTHQRRGLISHVHIWWGRILMVLGVINGGLGLQLADAKDSLIIAYSVVAAVTFLLYAVGKMLGSIQRRRAASPGSTLRKGESSSTTASPPRPYV